MTSLLQRQSMGALLGRTGHFCHLHSTGGSMFCRDPAHPAHAVASCTKSVLLTPHGLMQSMRTFAPHL